MTASKQWVGVGVWALGSPPTSYQISMPMSLYHHLISRTHDCPHCEEWDQTGVLAKDIYKQGKATMIRLTLDYRGCHDLFQTAQDVADHHTHLPSNKRRLATLRGKVQAASTHYVLSHMKHNEQKGKS